jgi:hypothetical protein
MRSGYQYTISKPAKLGEPKKQKRNPKRLLIANIAQQYAELQRLREKLSEAESWRRFR